VNKNNRTITDRDKGNARRLLALWQQKKRASVSNGEPFTQQIAAEQFGCTQGMIGQYLNGHAALNTDAILKFSRYLNVLPTAIDPEFQFADMLVSQLPPSVVAHLWKWMQLPPAVQKDIEQTIDEIAATNYAHYLEVQQVTNGARGKKKAARRPA
jgi:transcriptional regulator with XRE-family HTH domain